MDIKTFEEFYALMNKTRDIRREIVSLFLKNGNIQHQAIAFLIEALDSLQAIAQKNNRYVLALSQDKTIPVDLSYEITELEKDIFFLTHSETEFYSYLEGLDEDFSRQVNEVEAKLKDISFKNFITDRDGTISNYCGRYNSSIQAAYNAIFLSRFARKCVDNAVIMTSAPLENIGMLDVVVNPENTFIYAASKGREYFNKKGEFGRFPIPEEKQSKLNILNTKLRNLIQQPEYRIFSFIGSGLQLKFGQTTVAYQDISNSIPQKESKNFFEVIKSTVKDVDPEGNLFRIEDTGKDMEIILTIEDDDSGGQLKDFDKGDGIRFLDKDIGLKIENGPILICGDTKSDIPMISAAMKKTKDTWSIFVTTDSRLKGKVTQTCPNSLFVSTPDILVAILNNLGKN